MAKFKYYPPRIEQADPPAGEGFRISPPTGRGPWTDAELEGLLIGLYTEDVEATMAYPDSTYLVAEYPVKVVPMYVTNEWGEGVFQVRYLRYVKGKPVYLSDKSAGVVVDYPFGHDGDLEKEYVEP